MSGDTPVEALYDPDTGQIACVLIQAGVGGSSRVAQLFDPKDWATAPTPGMVRLPATMKQWEFVASMSRDERVRTFKEMREKEIR